MKDDTAASNHSVLLPKEGKETSSYTVAIVSAIAPIAAFGLIILGLIFVDEPRVKEALVNALLYVVLPGILASGVVGFKYIGARGAVSVAKAEAFADVVKTQITADASTANDNLTPRKDVE